MSALYYRKPVYVVCESFKFHKVYPLSQKDIAQDLLFRKDSSVESQRVAGSVCQS